MNTVMDQILALVQELDAEQRRELGEALVHDAGSEDDGWSADWAAECDRRLRAVDAGEQPLHSWEEAASLAFGDARR